MMGITLFSILAVSGTFANPVTLRMGSHGVVEGVENCGSAGEIQQVRVTACTVLPCDVIVGETYLIEVDFIPSMSHTMLLVEVAIVLPDSTEKPIISTNIEKVVDAGTSYTVQYSFKPTADLAVGEVKLKVKVSDAEVTELCGLARAKIHAHA